MKAALGIFLAIMAGGGANAGPDGKEVPRVAFLGFEFINTSLEATARVEVERIRLLDDVLRQKLTASSRFEIVDIPPDTIKEIASGPTSATATAASAGSRRWSARTGPRGVPCRR
jgi:hypothetical protein